MTQCPLTPTAVQDLFTTPPPHPLFSLLIRSRGTKPRLSFCDYNKRKSAGLELVLPTKANKLKLCAG